MDFRKKIAPVHTTDYHCDNGDIKDPHSPPKKRHTGNIMCKSMAASSDSAWQRRMDGFIGFAAPEKNLNKPVKAGAFHIKDTQSEIDWQSDGSTSSDSCEESHINNKANCVQKTSVHRPFYPAKRPRPTPQIRAQKKRKSESTFKTSDSFNSRLSFDREMLDLASPLSPGDKDVCIEVINSPDVKSAVRTGEHEMIENTNRKILQFESGDEEQCEQTQIEDVKDSPEIRDSTQSQDTQDDCAKKEAKNKASDWAKNLQQQLVTPEKPDETTSYTGDSTKKKPRYIKGGLAEKAQKALTSDKSAFKFWSHRSALDTPSQDSCYQDVYIHSLHQESMLIHAQCSRISPPDRTAKDDDSQREKCLVLFSVTTSNKYSLKPGVCVQIFPPWQTLSAGPSHTVFLCTDRCQVIQGPSHLLHNNIPYEGNCAVADSANNTPLHTSALWRTIARWQCPCSAGLGIVINSDLCPAHSNPSDPFSQKAQKDGDIGTTAESTDPHLQSVTDAMRDVSSSILECIEKRSCNESVIHFQATIQRIYKQKSGSCVTPAKSMPSQLSGITPVSSRGRKTADSANVTSYHLLVQDAQGFMSVIDVPCVLAEKDTWKKFLVEGEGCLCQFLCLSVGQRRMRSREPELFSIIDRAWHPPAHTFMDTSQDESQERSASCLVCPAFCYTLHAVASESSVEILSTNSSIFSPASSSTLFRIVSLDKPQRVSFTARVIYFKVSEDKSKADNFLLVTDSSLQSTADDSQAPRTVPCYVAENEVINSDTAILHKDIVITDAFFRRGKLYCDGYSLIRIRPEASESKHPSILLSSLDSHSQQDDLVMVEGRIEKVDEESAWLWQECPHCASDQLISQTNPRGAEMFCNSCRRAVSTCVERIQLEVYLSVAEVLQQAISSIKVKLLEKTIKNLLPDDNDSQTQGYDVESILLKSVGPISCLVSQNIPACKKNGSTSSKSCERLADMKLVEVSLA